MDRQIYYSCISVNISTTSYMDPFFQCLCYLPLSVSGSGSLLEGARYSTYLPTYLLRPLILQSTVPKVA